MSQIKIFFILIVAGCLLTSFFALAATTTDLLPVADGGDDSAVWQNSNDIFCDGTNCYIEVDDSSGVECTGSDGDTTFVKTSTRNEPQTFDIDESGIPDESTITQIDVTVCSKRLAPGASFKTRYCYNGICSNGKTPIGAQASYTEDTQSYSVNFTKTEDTDIEIGVIFTSPKEINISKVSAVITYTLPPYIAPDVSGLGRRTKVAFSGKAYPDSKVEILRRGTMDEGANYLTIPLEVHDTEKDGTFDLTLGALVSDQYFFALRAQDKEGRKTKIIGFNVDLKTTDSLEAENIFFPPTVDFEKTVVSHGEKLKIFGYAAPNTAIDTEITGLLPKKTESDENGYWTIDIETDVLSSGRHGVKARQVDKSGTESLFSTAKAFRISLLSHPEADFNNDDIIDVVDWSIFLFWWGNEDESLKGNIDLNEDNKINVQDFSLFLNAIKI